MYDEQTECDGSSLLVRANNQFEPLITDLKRIQKTIITVVSLSSIPMRFLME
jgi:hypothetical protein